MADVDKSIKPTIIVLVGLFAVVSFAKVDVCPGVVLVMATAVLSVGSGPLDFRF